MTMIDGVLIEGVDYVGKTTVARKVAQLLAAVSRPVDLGRCYVQPSPLVAFLEEEATKYDDMLARDYFYSAALIADLATLTPPSTYRVQDRHWLTQVGRNAFFHSGDDRLPIRYFEEAHLPFTHNVLLTSSAAAKAERAAMRPAKSPRDRYLKANPDVHQEYEAFLLPLLPPEENWLVLDTTGLSADDVARQVLARCGLLEPDTAVS
jgi:thymidylate kinase